MLEAFVFETKTTGDHASHRFEIRARTMWLVEKLYRTLTDKLFRETNVGFIVLIAFWKHK